MGAALGLVVFVLLTVAPALAQSLIGLPGGGSLGLRVFGGGGASIVSGSGTNNVLASFNGSGSLKDSSPAVTCDGTNCTLGSGQLIGPVGLVTAPTYSGTGVLTTGMYFTSAPSIRFAVGGVLVGLITGTAVVGETFEVGTNADVFLARAAAANLRLGAAAANPPVAQTLSVQNASGANIAGANVSHAASQSTGSGAGGSWIVQTSPAGGAGSSLNALVTAITVNSSGQLLASVATGGIGYGTGAGGAVTQLTDKATGVTSNTASTEVTMNGAALGSDTAVSFTFTNSAVAAADHMVCTHDSAGTAGSYVVVATSAAGSSVVTVRNITAGSLSEAIVLKCSLIKGATS